MSKSNKYEIADVKRIAQGRWGRSSKPSAPSWMPLSSTLARISIAPSMVERRTSGLIGTSSCVARRSALAVTGMASA